MKFQVTVLANIYLTTTIEAETLEEAREKASHLDADDYDSDTTPDIEIPYDSVPDVSELSDED